jgi:hypothetical protein
MEKEYNVKCFSIIKGKIHPYIDMRDFPWCNNFKTPAKATTAAMQLYVDSEWESQDIINGVRFHNNRDSLLYGIAYLTEGDTESSIIPKGTIAVSLPAMGHTAVIGTNDWSMPITFNSDRKIMLCFPGNTFLSTDDGKYIVNNDGKPAIVDTVPVTLEPQDGTIWEF